MFQVTQSSRVLHGCVVVFAVSLLQYDLVVFVFVYLVDLMVHGRPDAGFPSF